MPADDTRQYRDWMTLDEVAELTGRSVVLLRRWARQDRIPAHKVGRDWIVNEADIAAIQAMPKRKKGKRG